ncbi:MAG TPA: right-handed parallel beta-helix repeat-containing protein [Verrucomicrobiae bacterium]
MGLRAVEGQDFSALTGYRVHLGTMRGDIRYLPFYRETGDIDRIEWGSLTTDEACVTAQVESGGVVVYVDIYNGDTLIAANVLAACVNGTTFAPPGSVLQLTTPHPEWGSLNCGGYVFHYEFELVRPPITIYVDDSATGANNGSSWADAYNSLQDALSVTRAGDEVRVAAGTYKPDQGRRQTPGDRAATFLLKSGVTLKGGFAGVGAPAPEARDVELYETILSGDLAGNDVPVAASALVNEPTRAENSYHVLTGFATEATPPVLDGFTITGGNANGDYGINPRLSFGGGLLNWEQLGELTVSACTFTGNSASIDGGGIYVSAYSRPIVTDCTFGGNQAGGVGLNGTGGGISLYWGCAGTITRCNFSGNAGSGVALTFDGWTDFWESGREQSTTVLDCTFIGNSGGGAYGFGGGMYNGTHGSGYFNNSALPPTKVINCLFVGNMANWGGALFNLQSGVQIINCTIADNVSSMGGAMVNLYGGEAEKLIPAVSNSILWNNGADQIVDTYGLGNNIVPPITIVTYSDVQGGYPGTGNIDADPLFADTGGRLSGASPCINAGDNGAVPADVKADLDGHPRIVNGTVDLGAFESSPTLSITADFNGTPIPAGRTVWFNSVLKPQGLPGLPVTFRFTDSSIRSADGTISVKVPDAVITFDPAATCAETHFINGQWVTRAPASGLSGNTWLAGVGLPSSGLPGGIKDVTWSGSFICDTPGVSLQWKWSAAVYTSFPADMESLGVKAVDGNQDCSYTNSDHAGTPETIKNCVIGGARGGGGSNYTGGYSGTLGVTPCLGQ